MHTWQLWGALGPNVACLSAGGGGDFDELAPGQVSHTMGLPLLFPMQPLTPPSPELSETQKEAYIPRWRGEARWWLQ